MSSRQKNSEQTSWIHIPVPKWQITEMRKGEYRELETSFFPERKKVFKDY